MNRLTLKTISANDIVEINKMICNEQGQEANVLSFDRVESALHSAFYPGTPPYVHGGVAKLAGALLFYICSAHAFQDGNKRTAVVSALMFLNSNGWKIVFPFDSEKNIDALADLTLNVASGDATKEVCIEWFDQHKVLL
jgi:death-on-curing protein